MRRQKPTNPISLAAAPDEIRDLPEDDRPERVLDYTRVWTAEEQREALLGYMEVGPRFWPYVQIGQHVRYVTRMDDDTERFSGGGFVRVNPAELSVGGQCMKLNVRTWGAPESTWSLLYSRLVKLYVRVDAQGMIFHDQMIKINKQLSGRVQELTTHVQELTTHVQDVETRLARLEARAARKSRDA